MIRDNILLPQNINFATAQLLGRFNQYPKGSLLWLHLRCNDEVETERRLLIKFTERFEKIELYGNEYFSGDINDMMVLICSEIGHSCNAPTSVVKGTREQNILMRRIRELEEKNQILTKVKEYLRSNLEAKFLLSCISFMSIKMILKINHGSRKEMNRIHWIQSLL